tara:strand:- start:1521 stop:1739 length:219 start_codon:yes stop_codon:yes gene_type:complete
MSIVIASMSPHALDGAFAFLMGHWLLGLGVLASIGLGTLTVSTDKKTSRILYAVAAAALGWIFLGLYIPAVN